MCTSDNVCVLASEEPRLIPWALYIVEVPGIEPGSVQDSSVLLRV